MKTEQLSVGEVGIVDGVKVECIKATDKMRHRCFDCTFNVIPCKSILCIGATLYFRKIEE